MAKVQRSVKAKREAIGNARPTQKGDDVPCTWSPWFRFGRPDRENRAGASAKARPYSGRTAAKTNASTLYACVGGREHVITTASKGPR